MSEAAAGGDEIRYEIVTPTGPVEKGHCSLLVAPAERGEVGVLPNHGALLASLETGVVRITTSGEVHRIFVSRGFIEVLENKVVILAEVAERGDVVDVVRARSSLTRARERLDLASPKAVTSFEERNRARRSLVRARARLAAAGQSE